METGGSPKKKLKQEQSTHCMSAKTTSHKRKLGNSSDGLAPKLLRTGPIPGGSKSSVFSAIEKTRDDVHMKVYLQNDYDSKNDEPKYGVSQHKSIKEAPIEENVIKIEDLDVIQESESRDDGDGVSGTEPTQLRAASYDSKSLQGGLRCESNLKDEAQSSDSKAENDQVAINDVDSKDSGRSTDSDCMKYHADWKLDKSGGSVQVVANSSFVLSCDDEQLSSPNMKTPTTRKIMTTSNSSIKKADRARQQEEKLRLKREKEEQKRKAKEEKEKKKQEDLRLKVEEKKRKEEERERREEERRRNEEERKNKEEDRKNLARAAFAKFFIKDVSKPGSCKKGELEAKVEKTVRPRFMPFQVKSDMRIAVHVRHTLTNEEKNVLSEALASRKRVGDNYLKELRSGKKPKTFPATWPLSNEQHNVIIVESADGDKGAVEQEAKAKAKSNGRKAKLLQFHMNCRPPYWGTWRKRSKAVGPRRPFGQDEILDYAEDSDAEWVDEEGGEEVGSEGNDSDSEEPEDGNVCEDGYALDNKFFVRNGYHSDEEAGEAEDDRSVKVQKLNLTVNDLDIEMQCKPQRQKPRLLGCVRIPNKTLDVGKSIYGELMKMRCKWGTDEPIAILKLAPMKCSPSRRFSDDKFTPSVIKQLAILLHGYRSSMEALVSEFMNILGNDAQHSSLTKKAVIMKVKEISVKTYINGVGRKVFAVNPDLCAGFGLDPIVPPQKGVPAVEPIVEPPKPKDSPVAVSVKKKTTPQGPIKRVPTTLIPKAGPSQTAHKDKPIPKSKPHGSILAKHPDKPIRRVSTTLISPMTGMMMKAPYNVPEIDRPTVVLKSKQPATTKLKPHGSILANPPIRRVSTTLLSPMPDMVMNPPYNIREIDFPGKPQKSHQAGSGSTVCVRATSDHTGAGLPATDAHEFKVPRAITTGSSKRSRGKKPSGSTNCSQ